MNSCYVVRCAEEGDALALTALLNSAIVAAWLAVIAEPARGGFRRYLGWTMALLPVPKDWKRAVELLAPIAQRARDGEPPSESVLLAAALKAYGLAASDIAPLLEWSR